MIQIGNARLSLLLGQPINNPLHVRVAGQRAVLGHSAGRVVDELLQLCRIPVLADGVNRRSYFTFAGLTVAVRTSLFKQLVARHIGIYQVNLGSRNLW